MDKLLLANTLSTRIDEKCQEMYDDGHRSHLGASLIGHECSRYLWYVFRWAFHKQHSGQLYRLFNRGHLEEIRIVEWLRETGFVVREFDTDGVTQFRISDCGGHFGGSTDGEVELPEDLKHFYDGTLLLECKTINDKGYKTLIKDGVVRAQPKHFSQMCTYGAKRDYQYALYISINKNTDQIYIEIVELDHEHGNDCLKRAESIINSALPPQKLSQQSTHFKCKWCDMAPICHHGREMDRNCRSCRFAEPMDNKVWQCNKWNAPIPKEALVEGCGDWVSIQEN